MRRWARLLVVGILVTVLLLSVLPTMLAKTPLKQILLDYALAKNDLHGSLEAVEFGWLTPLRVRRLLLERTDASWKLSVEGITHDETIISLLNDWPDLGSLVIDQPTIDLVLDAAVPAAEDESGLGRFGFWTGQADVIDATLMIRSAESDEPLVELRRLDVTARVQHIRSERVLTIEPVKILDDQPLTPELFDHGLQLVAPLLANSTRLQGRGTVTLNELRLPLRRDDDENLLRAAVVRGRVALSDLEAGLSPAIETVAARVAGILGLDIPDTVRLVNSEVGFEVRDGRVFHDSLTFLIPDLSPDLVWQTSGSVGLDETLDLEVETRLPLTLLGNGPLLRNMSARPVRFRVIGTLDEPRLDISEGTDLLFDWSRDLLARTRSEEDGQSEGSSLVDLFEAVLSENPEAINVAPLINQIRDFRATRDVERAEEAHSEGSSTEPAKPWRGLLRRRFRREEAESQKATENRPSVDAESSY